MKFTTNFTSNSNGFSPRLLEQGTYKNAKCIKCQDINKPGNRAIAVLEWAVPGKRATIQDFILDVADQSAADYTIAHAKELALAIGVQGVTSESTLTLEQAATIFQQAVGHTADVVLTNRTANDQTYTNVKYMSPSNAPVVAQPAAQPVAVAAQPALPMA